MVNWYTKETRLEVNRLSKVYAKMSNNDLNRAYARRGELNDIEYEVLLRTAHKREPFRVFFQPTEGFDLFLWYVGIIAIGYSVIKLSIWLTTGDWLL